MIEELEEDYISKVNLPKEEQGSQLQDKVNRLNSIQ